MAHIPPQLILIRGPIGVGKTTTVKQLRETLQPASVVELDVFKRQIDTVESTAWRRETALRAAIFMTSELMRAKRVIIADAHSSSHEQLAAYRTVAQNNQYRFRSYLLYAPLETCLSRAKERFVEDIHYPIDEPMIRRYHETSFDLPQEMKFDTLKMTTEAIVNVIRLHLKANTA